MFAASTPQAQERGAGLLLEHCAALARLDNRRPAPFDRLEALVGTELARLLVHGLAGGPARRARA
jgi:hypothetical protein